MFDEWGDFYLMVGGAAAALIGLLFVVATLTVGLDHHRAQRGASVFMTPTVFHFAIIVVISAVTMAPHVQAAAAAGAFAAAALIGLVYVSRIVVALSKAGASEHWTDIWFYGAAPLAWYAGLAAAALAIWRGAPYATFLLAALVVALLLLGVRNAWDLVTWIAPRIEQMKQPDESAPPP